LTFCSVGVYKVFVLLKGTYKGAVMSCRYDWTRREFLQKTSVAAVAAAATGPWLEASAKVASPRRPNILFVFPDEMRGQSVGYMGQEQVRTPHIDQLASEGVVFPTTCSNTPLCSPGRATMFTGKYPHKHGVRSNDMPLESNNITIANLLNDQGYRTGFVGKWHLQGGPRVPGFVPPGEARMGFQWWAANECNHNYFNSCYFRDSAEKIPIQGYDAFTWTDLAVDFLKEQRSDQPFCLVVAYDPPHFPEPPSLVAPDTYLKLYDPAKISVRPNWQDSQKKGTRREDIAGYYAAITCIDDQVGRLIKAVDDLGFKENTIVVFTSDHGDMMGSHGLAVKEKPWEESIRVPGIIRYPSKLKAGQRNNDLFSHVDMLPTLLGLTGVAKPANLQGTDFSPGLLGKPFVAPPVVYFQNYMPENPSAGTVPTWRAVRTIRYKYARTQEKPWLLYDLQEDPYELHNLVDKRESVALQKHMEAELRSSMRKSEDSWEYDITEFVNLWKVTPERYQDLMKEIRDGKLAPSQSRS
jgi:arylsulfatase A-like enzyme